MEEFQTLAKSASNISFTNETKRQRKLKGISTGFEIHLKSDNDKINLKQLLFRVKRRFRYSARRFLNV